MSVLVIAEHDNHAIKPATLNTVTAALALGSPVILVIGSDCGAAAQAAAKIKGVERCWSPMLPSTPTPWPRRRRR